MMKETNGCSVENKKMNGSSKGLFYTHWSFPSIPACAKEINFCNVFNSSIILAFQSFAWGWTVLIGCSIVILGILIITFLY